MTISPPLLLSWTSDRLSMICNWQHCTVGCSLSFGQRAFLKDKKQGKRMIYSCSFPLKCSKECLPSPWTALLVLAVDIINVVTKRIMYSPHISCIVSTNLPPQKSEMVRNWEQPSPKSPSFHYTFQTCPDFDFVPVVEETSFFSNQSRQHYELSCAS